MVALGASNLTRGLPTIVAAAQSSWGPAVELLAALGLGRSYGAQSRVAIRTLPSILESGLWAQLERMPAARTLGLITDVGNDIPYGFSAAQILEWVDEAARRLQAVAQDVVLTDLPLASVRPISRAKFLFFRSIFFPPCRLTYEEVEKTAGELNAGLEHLAVARGLRFFRLRPEWYGFDPIHIRPSRWREAWRAILSVETDAGESGRVSRREALRLYAAPPERQWLCGIERKTPQRGTALRSGGRLWLY